MTAFYSNWCYNGMFYKGTALYIHDTLKNSGDNTLSCCDYKSGRIDKPVTCIIDLKHAYTAI